MRVGKETEARTRRLAGRSDEERIASTAAWRGNETMFGEEEGRERVGERGDGLGEVRGEG